MLGRYLLALLLTLIIEGAAAYLLGFRTGRFLTALAAINVITNPALNYLLLVLAYLGTDISLVLVVFLEILVVLVERQLLVYVFPNPQGRFLILSIVANAASFFIGCLRFWSK
jgi:hypothetical protein